MRAGWKVGLSIGAGIALVDAVYGSLCWVTLLAAGTAAARRAVGARAIRLADAVAGAGLIAFGVALVAL